MWIWLNNNNKNNNFYILWNASLLRLAFKNNFCHSPENSRSIPHLTRPYPNPCTNLAQCQHKHVNAGQNRMNINFIKDRDIYIILLTNVPACHNITSKATSINNEIDNFLPSSHILNKVLKFELNYNVKNLPGVFENEQFRVRKLALSFLSRLVVAHNNQNKNIKERNGWCKVLISLSISLFTIYKS